MMYAMAATLNISGSPQATYEFTEVDTINGFSISQVSNSVITLEGGFTKDNFMLLNMPMNSDPMVSCPN